MLPFRPALHPLVSLQLGCLPQTPRVPDQNQEMSLAAGRRTPRGLSLLPILPAQHVLASTRLVELVGERADAIRPGGAPPVDPTTPRQSIVHVRLLPRSEIVSY